MLTNPYITGNPVGDTHAFIGRGDILREVKHMLRRPNENAIVLYGQRRMGKTSVLQHLEARLSTEGNYYPVYIDLQDRATSSLAQVVNNLAQLIAHSLQLPEPDLKIDPETLFHEWLSCVLDDELPVDKSLVLLFDEFDVLAEPQAKEKGSAFVPYLRKLMNSNTRKLNFIFVIGRNVDELGNIALSLVKNIPTYRVSLLDSDDTKLLVRLSETNDSLNWTDEAVEYIWKLTNGHAYLTQQLCSHVWEQAYDEEPDMIPNIVQNDVEKAIPDALEGSRSALEWLWGGLPPAGRVVASALAEAGQKTISQQALESLLNENGIRVILRELQNAPRLLKDWDLLESAAEGEYCFRVELLRRWIKSNKPLLRVQEELDKVEPVAESLFQAAHGLYQIKNLEGAVGLLNQAVGLNPNHVGGNQLLADILFAQGKVKEAKDLLEQLYDYQPAAARERLIYALLTLARHTNSEEELLAFFDSVLKLDPKRSEAINGKKEIWLQRGNIALEKSDFENAIDAYRRAGRNDKIAEVEQKIIPRHELEEQRKKIEAKKEQENYHEALELTRKLVDSFPYLKEELHAEIKDLEQLIRLQTSYQRALVALQEGKPANARKLFIEVLKHQPDHRDIPMYLHLSGNDLLNKLKEAENQHDNGNSELNIKENDPDGKPKDVVCAAFSFDGQRLVTASNSNIASLWDVTTGKKLATLEGHEDIITNIAVSSDGANAVTTSKDMSVRLWNCTSGEQFAVLAGHNKSVIYIIFSPDGRYVLTTSRDMTVRIWEVETGKQRGVLKGYGDIVIQAAFSLDGKQVITASRDNIVNIWDINGKQQALWHIKTGKQLVTQAEYKEGIEHVAFSSSGQRLLIILGDNAAYVWDVKARKQVITLKGHKDIVVNGAFSPNGQRIVTTSQDKTARLWDANTGEQLAVLTAHEEVVEYAAFSPNGRLLLTASRDWTIRLWDVNTGEEVKLLAGHRGALTKADFSPDGKYVISQSSEDASVCLWNTSTGEQTATLAGHNGLIYEAVVSRNEEYILTACADNTAYLWDINTGMQIRTLNGHEKDVYCAAFSPDGQCIITASEDKTARLWDTDTGKQLIVLPHEKAVTHAAFSFDGKYAGTACRDMIARLWDVKTGSQLIALAGHEDVVIQLVFSPDSKHIVTVSIDKSVLLWDIDSGKSTRLRCTIEK